MDLNLKIIDSADLAEIVSTQSGCQVFGEALGRIAEGKELLRVLGLYISFNSVFGSGVASLAAHVRLRQDLFRDPNETPDVACVRVAESIFFAAIGEFGDRTHTDHRTLALATWKGAASFFGYGQTEFNSLVCPDGSAKTAMRRVLDGYGFDRPFNEQKVFSSIGFHISSEMLADEEFNLLDGFLRSRYPDLVQYLRKAKVEISGRNARAYDWIQIHKSAEADHLSTAIAGANLALRYYAGKESITNVKRWILDGFKEFGGIQTEFMRSFP